eukprot:244418-Pyramimonas_sp.AAC.1
MSSAEPSDHQISSEHLAGITYIQAKDLLSADATAQPFASQSMGSQEGARGRTEDRRPSELNGGICASTRRQHFLNLPSKKSAETMFDMLEGDSSVDSVIRSRGEHSSG